MAKRKSEKPWPRETRCGVQHAWRRDLRGLPGGRTLAQFPAAEVRDLQRSPRPRSAER